MFKLTGTEALAKALRNKVRKYPDRADGRYEDNFLWPDVQPRFRFAEGQTVFTIGSCFARNVEEELATKGMVVPTLAFKTPEEEAPGRPNRVLNQYNPATMLQAVRSVETDPDERGLYQVGIDRCVDSLLATGSRAVSHARAMERRGQIGYLYRDGLAAAEVVVVTLGLVETWYDAEADLYLNEAPPPR